MGEKNLLRRFLFLFIVLGSFSVWNQVLAQEYQVFYHWSKKDYNDPKVETGFFTHQHFEPSTRNHSHHAGTGLYVSTIPFEYAGAGREDAMEVWVEKKNLKEKKKKKIMYPYYKELNGNTSAWVLKEKEGLIIRPFFGIQYTDKELNALIQKISQPKIKNKYINLVERRKEHFLWVETEEGTFCFEQSESKGTFLHPERGKKFRKISSEFCPAPEIVQLETVKGTRQDIEIADQRNQELMELELEKESHYICVKNRPSEMVDIIQEDLQNILSQLASGGDPTLLALAEELWPLLVQRKDLRLRVLLKRKLQAELNWPKQKEDLLKENGEKIKAKEAELVRVMQYRQNELAEKVKQQKMSLEEREKIILNMNKTLQEEVGKYGRLLQRLVDEKEKKLLVIKPEWEKKDPALALFFAEDGWNHLKRGRKDKQEETMTAAIVKLKEEIQALKQEHDSLPDLE